MLLIVLYSLLLFFFQESGKCCEDGNRGSLPSQPVSYGIQNGTKAVPGGSVDEPKSRTVTEFCQHMFLDIVKSEKFAQLCHVLFENFEGMKADKFFDISRIHSRMKDGSYEGSSLLFHSDIQQVLFCIFCLCVGFRKTAMLCITWTWLTI